MSARLTSVFVVRIRSSAAGTTPTTHPRPMSTAAPASAPSTARRDGCQAPSTAGAATASPATTSASQFVLEPSTTTRIAVRMPNTIAAAVRIGDRFPTHQAG